MARKVLEIAEREDYELTQGTLQFLEAHSPSVVQPTLPAAHVTGLGGPWRGRGCVILGGQNAGGARVTAGALLRCGKSLSAVCRLPMPPLALSDAFSLPKLRPSKRTEPREG